MKGTPMLFHADPAGRRRADEPDTLLARFHRLTQREVRLLILSVGDQHSYAELAEALGVSHNNVANSLARIRRKLGVAPGQKLTAFVAAAPELAEVLLPHRAADTPSAPEVSRRRKDVLRVTIADLERLAGRTRQRAVALESLGDEGEELVARREEAAMVDRIADVIEGAIAQILREVRQDVAVPA